MAHIEQSPANRFNELWNTIASGGEDIRVFGPTGMIYAKRITGENGSSKEVVIRAHNEPHVIGSLRPRVRTLEVVTADGESASITDGQVVFIPKDKRVLDALKLLEGTLPPKG